MQKKDGGDVLDNSGKPLHETAVLILSDPMPHLFDANGPQATNTRMLREAFWRIRTDGAFKTIILIGEGIKLGEDVSADVWNTRFELPTAGEIHKYLAPVFEEFKVSLSSLVTFEDAALVDFSRACAGLPLNTARSLLSRSITHNRAVDGRAIFQAHDEKRAIVRRSGVARLQEPRGGLEMVGGLKHFKSWVEEVDPMFKGLGSAREFGCRFPAGAALIGVPGCGKSLMAEGLAGHWKLPMLTLEMGAIFGSLVGESEKKLRQFQDLAKAIKPCLVFVDEIEKGIGSDGDMDGGTTGRVKQSLLTWLSEKDDEIIVIATANRIEAFDKNPEFLRRFENIWFVDLPDPMTRLEIAQIHLRKAKQEVAAAELAAMVKATHGHSGAEIERAVQTALRWAFAAGKIKVTGATLLKAAQEIVPLSHTMAPRIAQLREYVKNRRAKAAGALLEEQTGPAQAAPVVANGFAAPKI
jgi:hypothetical protein